MLSVKFWEVWKEESLSKPKKREKRSENGWRLKSGNLCSSTYFNKSHPFLPMFEILSHPLPIGTLLVIISWLLSLHHSLFYKDCSFTVMRVRRERVRASEAREKKKRDQSFIRLSIVPRSLLIVIAFQLLHKVQTRLFFRHFQLWTFDLPFLSSLLPSLSVLSLLANLCFIHVNEHDCIHTLFATWFDYLPSFSAIRFQFFPNLILFLTPLEAYSLHPITSVFIKEKHFQSEKFSLGESVLFLFSFNHVPTSFTLIKKCCYIPIIVLSSSVQQERMLEVGRSS